MTPHMPALVELRDCHIYADVCSTAVIFLQLFKYLFKGPNRTRLSLRALSDSHHEKELVNEYEDYVSAR